MRISIQSSPGLRGFFVFYLVVLSLLAGCGKKQRADQINPHSVTLNWNASTTPVAGYNVYRVSSSGGSIRMTNTIISGTQYTDRTVGAGQTYSYYVTAVDSKGIESKPSEKMTVTVPTTVTPPAKQ